MIRVSRSNGFRRELGELAVCSRLKPLLVRPICSDKVRYIRIVLSVYYVIHTTPTLHRLFDVKESDIEVGLAFRSEGGNGNTRSTRMPHRFVEG